MGGKMSRHFKNNDIDNLCMYLGDDLNKEKCEEIKNELHNCPECSMILDEIQGTIELYRKALPHKQVPLEIVKRLKFKLNIPEG